VSDETVRTIWMLVAGFVAYAVGFAQAMFMVWWKAYAYTKVTKKVHRFMLDSGRVRSTAYSG